MKKAISLLLCLTIFLIVQGQVLKTIDVPTAGTLSALLTVNEKASVTQLTITGNINSRDFVCLRDSMTNLAVLDISAVNIKYYLGGNGTSPIQSAPYPANEIPVYSFRNTTTVTSKITLKTATLPNSITSIGYHAFDGCVGMVNITLPNSLKGIGTYAFTNCMSLTSFSIPETVTTIGKDAFASCNALMYIYAYPTIPIDLSTSADVFLNVNKLACILYVPKGSRTLYQAANQWQDFVNIIEMTTDVPTLSDANVNLYPNPVSNFFKIAGTGVGTVWVTDLNGRTIFISQFIGNENISVVTLSKGMFIAKIITDKAIFERKIVKQ